MTAFRKKYNSSTGLFIGIKVYSPPNNLFSIQIKTEMGRNKRWTKRTELKNMKKRSEMEYVWLKFHAREIDNEKRKPKGRYIVNKK